MAPCKEHTAKTNQLTTVAYATTENTPLPMPPVTGPEDMDWHAQTELELDPQAASEPPAMYDIFASNAAALPTSAQPLLTPQPSTLASTSRSETSGDRVDQRVKIAALAPKLSRQLNDTWLLRQVNERTEEQAKQVDMEALKKEREHRLQWEFMIKFWDKV